MPSAKQKAEIYVKQVLGVASTARFPTVKNAYLSGYAEGVKDTAPKPAEDGPTLAETRCVHDVHGTDCFECFPTEDAPDQKWKDFVEHLLEMGVMTKGGSNEAWAKRLLNGEAG